MKILKLEPGVVYGFTAVAKKSLEVPELHQQIEIGAFTVATAKRMTSVLNNENKNEWFEKARALSTRKLEKEVARANPKEEVKERASYLNSKRVRLELGLDEATMLLLRRAQDLECQRRRRHVTLEETLRSILDDFLQKRDPVRKAERALIRGLLVQQYQSHP